LGLEEGKWQHFPSQIENIHFSNLEGGKKVGRKIEQSFHHFEQNRLSGEYEKIVRKRELAGEFITFLYFNFNFNHLSFP
jgi:hypothetical protein